MGDNDQYTVGWIAPLPLELTAATAALEERYADFYHDQYKYRKGRIGKHYIVIAVQARMGTNDAAALATRMKSVFRRIKFFLVVGIAGGIPRYGPSGDKREMVLGDIVVSRPRGAHGGIVLSGSGAWLDVASDHKAELNIQGHCNAPPPELLQAVNDLESEHDSRESQIPVILKELRENLLPKMRTKFMDPGPDEDRSFHSEYLHADEDGDDLDCVDCCDLTHSQLRKYRGPQAIRKLDNPHIHYGNIASSNQLQISASLREKMHKEHNVIAFEMEGAGVIQNYNCLVIRGICDYSDSHKNKQWQRYAAAVAAAYARELLATMDPETSSDISERPRGKFVHEYFRRECI